MYRSKPTIEFKVDIIAEPDEDGFYAYCPALKGLHVGGDTEEEAVQNAKDAAIAYLESLMKHGEPIPVGIIVKEKWEEIFKPPTSQASHHTEELQVACVT